MNHANKISELEAENVDLKETVIIHAADLHNKTAKFDKEKDDTIKFLESQCKHWKNEFEKELKLNMKMTKKLEDHESKLVESAFFEPGNNEFPAKSNNTNNSADFSTTNTNSNYLFSTQSKPDPTIKAKYSPTASLHKLIKNRITIFSSSF